MGWFGKLSFGALGLFLGGPLGAIAGAVLGHHLLDKGDVLSNRTFHVPQAPAPGYTEQAQAAYFISLFSILGKFSKLDGVVTRHEISIVQDFINHLPVSDREKEFAKQVFKEAKDSTYSIEDFARQLFHMTGQQPAVLQSFLDLLFKIAAADGTLHPSEETALKRIQTIFQITDHQFESIKSVYFKDLDKYYKILNSTPASAKEEIKASYKRLVKDFHPDAIISKGLPEEFIDFASNRFREIQEAYEKIRKERNL